MTLLEGTFLWAAVAGYALALVVRIAAFLFRRERWTAVGTWMAVAAWVSHSLTIVVRWIESGHAPVQGAYENSIAGAWFLLPLTAGAARWYRPIARALPLVLAATLLILGNGIMAPTTIAPLEPPYRSNWLAVHVLFAWVAFGSYVVAAALAAWVLWLTRSGRTSDRAPVVDEVTGRLVAVGFLCHTVMIASGAIWAHGLWGRYWGWDPIETWSLVTWLVYGVYLHLRFTLGWQGRRAAWVALVAAVSIIITFFGLGVVDTVHTELL